MIFLPWGQAYNYLPYFDMTSVSLILKYVLLRFIIYMECSNLYLWSYSILVQFGDWLVDYYLSLGSYYLSKFCMLTTRYVSLGAPSLDIITTCVSDMHYMCCLILAPWVLSDIDTIGVVWYFDWFYMIVFPSDMLFIQFYDSWYLSCSFKFLFIH